MVGGDGTVGDVAGALAGTQTTLTVIPAGTGNDFARSLGLSVRDPLRALGGLQLGRSMTIDVGVCTGSAGTRRFVNVAGAGFDAAVNETANGLQLGLEGTTRYLVALAATLRRFEAMRFELVLDGSPLQIDAMLVAVCNAPSYGGGMRVAPDARTDDGLFDVCIVEAMSRSTFVASFPKVYRGTHVRHPKVRMLRAATVELAADRGAHLFADGEDAGELPVSLTVEPSALLVTVPE